LAHAPLPELKKWITQDIAQASGLKPPYQFAIDIQRQEWQGNPFTEGAYAYYQSGQWFTVRPILRRSHSRVHFAGEHLDDDWQGFMEGAVSTGEAAASRI
jgi:monoamine oxidase